MRFWIIFLCIGLQTVLSAVAVPEGDCPATNGGQSVLKLSFDRRMNDSDGQWMTTFSARKRDSDNSTADLKLEGTHSTRECLRNREIYVEITIKDGHVNHSVSRTAKNDASLRFHHRHSLNVVLFNGGLSAQRINLENLFQSGVFTNRPLRDDEMFQLRLDKRYIDKNHCHGIGVMTHSPDEVKLADSMYFNEGTWIFYGMGVYGGNKVVVPNYGDSLCHTKVGETIGVMKRGNGSLHFFVNGVDQGPAISNAPSILYGVYEVRGMAAIATMVSGEQ